MIPKSEPPASPKGDQKEETPKKDQAQDSEINTLKDKLLRLGAEFDNYKKRVQKERLELVKYAGESFVLELLHIIDNFERAFQAADKTRDFKVLHQGVEMILREVQNFLKDKGVKKIVTAGEKFDPHRHEAVETLACADKPENLIIEELQSGYELNGKIIRPAKVKVSKKTNNSV
ncbi:MAG: nucleotide exchange factor GrpE [Candidatus Omnitrophica bacterium]|nr:nucleotide exchange factor GrpE [Candidatus Omnitrophota bacterium]